MTVHGVELFSGGLSRVRGRDEIASQTGHHRFELAARHQRTENENSGDIGLVRIAAPPLSLITYDVCERPQGASSPPAKLIFTLHATRRSNLAPWREDYAILPA